MTDENPRTHGSTPGPSRRLLWLALACHLALATTYAFLTPAFEGPDENDHVYYAYFLHTTGQLPVIKGSGATAGRSIWDEAVLAHHPPLYYAIASTVSGDRLPSWRLNPEFATSARSASLHKLHGADETDHVSEEISALHWMRLVSVACGLLSVALTWLLGRRLFPDRPAIAGIAALTLACVPQWSWVHGTVENGNLATTLGLAATVVLVGGVQARSISLRRGLTIGALVGAALMTKLTSIFLLPLCALVWGIDLLRGSARGRSVLAGVAALGAIAAIAGWFFLRNHGLYADPLGLSAHETAFVGNRLADVAAATGRPVAEVRFEYLTGDFVLRSLQTTVGGFGWSGARMPLAEIVALLTVVLSALGWSTRGRELVRGRTTALLVILAALALVTLGLVRFNWTFVQPQGRYLFPALGPLLVLVAAGLVALFGNSRHRVRLGAIAIYSVALVASAALGILWAWTFLDARIAPADDARFASLVSGVTTAPAPDLATIAPLGPDDGARLDEAPTFRWRDVGAPEDARYTIHVVLPSGLGLGTFESAGLEIAGDSWHMHDAIWQNLPTDATIRWKVRRLPNRASGEGVRDVPESPFGTLVRAR